MYHTNPNHYSTKRWVQLVAQLAKISADMVEVMTTDFFAETLTPNQTASTQSDTVPPTSAPEPEPQPRQKPASKAEVLASVKVARDVIGLQNQPVQVSALFQEVIARGFVINTPKPVLTYAARLRDYRDRVGLKYLEGLGWWLAERLYPPANYVPTNITRIGKHIVQ
jgi:hypothetical protein